MSGTDSCAGSGSTGVLSAVGCIIRSFTLINISSLVFELTFQMLCLGPACSNLGNQNTNFYLPGLQALQGPDELIALEREEGRHRGRYALGWPVG